MIKNLFLLLFSCCSMNGLTAEELKLFVLTNYETGIHESKTFVSLSDIYPLSENSDSLAIPDLSDVSADEAKHYEYFKLDSGYRNQFLSRTTILETDKVFIYSYSMNKLISFPVKKLSVVACLNIYGADWPYTQYDFMIGFEIDSKFLVGFEESFVNTLVYVGKKCPFVLNRLQPVVWKKIDSNDFPSGVKLSYDTNYAGKCYIEDTYTCETDDFQYYIQDMKRYSDNWNSVKHLWVKARKSKKLILEKIYYAGESAMFAPLDNQWTGKLFKKKPPVIFGFQWVTFGCPFITFLNMTEKDNYINCDNRH